MIIAKSSAGMQCSTSVRQSANTHKILLDEKNNNLCDTDLLFYIITS